MTMEAMVTQAGGDMFDRILEAEDAVLVLETGEMDMLIEQFRRLAQRSGQAVYLWRDGVGLHSLREGEVRVPGCLRAGDTLRYVLQSMRFGIYLMVGLAPPLSTSQLSLLRRITRAQTNFVRRVVLLSDTPALGESLKELAMPLHCHEVLRARPRLRDGRWVV